MANKPKRKGRGKTGSKNQRFSKRQRDVESIDMESNSKLPDQRGDSDYHRGKPNDWRWYAQSPQLVKDYSDYSFGNPVGNKLTTGVGVIDVNGVPGVMAIAFTPTIGAASNSEDPINVAMRKLYSFVRHANSGSKNYDAPDLMLYMLAADSCYMYLAFLKRIYGIAVKDYTAFNRYYPRALIEAMDINFDDISDNIVQLRGYINQLAFKLTQIWIPNSMSYMARHSWMCEAIYTDSMSRKAQTYFYYPANYLQFSLDSSGAGQLQYVALPTRATYAQLAAFGNSLLAPILSNEDMGIMGGDILKAFGAGGIVTPIAITEDYQVLPVYDQEVLSQMENLTVFPGVVTGGGITQNTAVGGGYLQQSALISCNFPIASEFGITSITSDALNDIKGAFEAIYGSKRILNFHKDEISPADIMVATRLANIAHVQQVSFTAATNMLNVQMTCSTYGSEVITGARMYFFAGADRHLDYTDIATALVLSTGRSAPNATNASSLVLAQLASFDWHFAVYPAFVNYDSAVTQPISLRVPQSIILDFDYFTVIDEDNLRNMMLAATLSEFTVPMIQ